MKSIARMPRGAKTSFRVNFMAYEKGLQLSENDYEGGPVRAPGGSNQGREDKYFPRIKPKLSFRLNKSSSFGLFILLKSYNPSTGNMAKAHKIFGTS